MMSRRFGESAQGARLVLSFLVSLSTGAYTVSPWVALSYLAWLVIPPVGMLVGLLISSKDGRSGLMSIELWLMIVASFGMLIGMIKELREMRKSAVICAPGRWIRAVTECLFARQTFEGVFAPLLADQAKEWSDAIVQGRPWKACWIRLRYAYLFARHFVLQSPLSMLKVVLEVWRALH